MTRAEGPTAPVGTEPRGLGSRARGRYERRGRADGRGVMFRRVIRSALLIDYDNIERLIGAAGQVESWLHWLEDGQFDEKKTRRSFVVKRVYWNAAGERHKEAYEKFGFTVRFCPSIVRVKKSAADMVLALDAYELLLSDKKIDEFIIGTMDSDFIPILERISSADKMTAVVADQNSDVVYEAYRRHADIAIPAYQFERAKAYRRPEPRRWWRLLGGKAETRKPAAEETPAAAPAKPAAASDPDQLRKRAAELIVALGLETPALFLSKRLVCRTLALQLESFSASGRRPFLGHGDYRSMIAALAKLEPRIKTRRLADGGLQVWIVKSAKK